MPKVTWSPGVWPHERPLACSFHYKSLFQHAPNKFQNKLEAKQWALLGLLARSKPNKKMREGMNIKEN